VGISIFKLKKWANMLAGKSIYHVNQGKGKAYSMINLLDTITTYPKK
jgi:hypothetical protein